MTIPETECCLCASIMDAPTAQLSPTVCTALAFADHWESPEASKVAHGIQAALNKGRPTHRVVVGLLMDQEYREWLRHPQFNDALPLSCVDSAIAPLLAHYQNKRIVAMLGKAYEAASRNLNQAGYIGHRLIMDLEELCK